MGNEQSSSSTEGGEQYGFRVLGIQEKSPSCAAGFVSFFDFIIAANGIRLDHRDNTFLELIGNSEDSPMQLSVYNVKSHTTREVSLTPSSNWAGKGLLGVTIRFDCFEGAEDEVIHMLEVSKNSPADLAGLEAFNDYLLGTPERVFKDADDLYDEIMDNVDRPFQSYVYNINTDQVRIVTILPNSRWGGEGLLGGEIGFGFLHRLPEQSRTSTGTSTGYVSIAANVVAATESFSRTNSIESTTEALEDISLTTAAAAGAQEEEGEEEEEKHEDIPQVVVAAEDVVAPTPAPAPVSEPSSVVSFSEGSAVVIPPAQMGSS